jgi:hypothetical protein
MDQQVESLVVVVVMMMMNTKIHLKSGVEQI